MNVRHASRDGVLNRDHAEVGLTGLHSVERIFKRGVRDSLQMWERLFARNFRICATLALECDLACHFNLSCDAREGNHAAAKSASALFLNRKRPE